MIRIDIRVTPGAKRTAVGGEHDGALIVRVQERATDGKATAAALAAVARALGLRTRAVTLVTGQVSRRKIIDIDPGDADEATLRSAVDALRRS